METPRPLASPAPAGTATPAPGGSAAARPIPQHFTALQSSSSAVEVTGVVWCAAMDVVAVVTRDNRITVYRLYQVGLVQLYTIAADAVAGTDSGAGGGLGSPNTSQSGGGGDSIPSVTAVCWHPDGRYLCIGQRDGRVTLYAVETGDRAFTHSPGSLHAAAVLAADWIDVAPAAAAGSGAATTDRAAHMFGRRLPPLPKAHTLSSLGAGMYLSNTVSGLVASTAAAAASDQSAHPAAALLLTANSHAPARPDFDTPPRTLLVTGDASGIIHITAFGVCRIASVDTTRASLVSSGAFGSSLSWLAAASSTSRATPRSVIRLNLSTNLSSLAVAVRHQHSSDSSSPNADAASVSLLHFDTHALSNYVHEWSHVSVQSQHIAWLIRYIDDGLGLMATRWNDARMTITRKFDILTELQEKHNSDSGLEEEVLSMLVCGSPSEPFHHFISKYVSPVQASRMHKAIDTSCVVITDLLGLCVMPAIEELVFRLVELRACARHTHRFAAVGLTPPPAGAADTAPAKSNAAAASAATAAGSSDAGLQGLIDHASALLLKFEQLRKTTVNVRKNYAAFFLWLDACSNNLADERDETLPPLCPAVDVDRIMECVQTEFATDLIGSSFLPDPNKPIPVVASPPPHMPVANTKLSPLPSVADEPPHVFQARWKAASEFGASALRHSSRALMDGWHRFVATLPDALSQRCAFDPSRSVVAFSPSLPSNTHPATASSSLAASPVSSSAASSLAPSAAASVLSTPAADRRSQPALFSPAAGGTGGLPPVPLFSPLVTPHKPSLADLGEHKTMSTAASSKRTTPQQLPQRAISGASTAYALALNPSVLSPSLIAMTTTAANVQYIACSGIDAATACPFIAILCVATAPTAAATAPVESSADIKIDDSQPPQPTVMSIATLVFPSLIGRQLALQQSRKSAAAAAAAAAIAGGSTGPASPKPIASSLSLGNPIIGLSFYKDDTLAVLVRTEETAAPAPAASPNKPAASPAAATAAAAMSSVCSRLWFVEIGDTKVHYEPLPPNAYALLLQSALQSTSGAAAATTAAPSLLQFAAHCIRAKYPNRKQLLAVAASPAVAAGGSVSASPAGGSALSTPVKAAASNLGFTSIATASPTSPGTGTGFGTTGGGAASFSVPFSFSVSGAVTECGLLGSRRAHAISVAAQRDLHHTYATSTFHIGRKGIGTILCGTRRLLLFDVEEHELITATDEPEPAASATPAPAAAATPQPAAAAAASRTVTPAPNAAAAAGRRTPSSSGVEKKYPTPQAGTAASGSASRRTSGVGGSKPPDADGDSLMS